MKILSIYLSILFYFLLVVNLQNLNAQQLGLNETIAYINKSFGYDRKISLGSDGMFEFSGTHLAINKPFKYKVHISEVVVSNQIKQQTESSNLPFYIEITTNTHKKNSGSSYITYILNDKSSNVSDIRIFTKNYDSYSTEKLLNAFKYLFSLAEENGLMNRVDDDPFAPQNYNPNRLEVVSSNSNGKIKLQHQNGVYYIPVSIGGIERNFVFDTGASEVLISTDLERQLIENGVIKKDNYLPFGLYQIADGSIVQCRRLILPKINIENIVVKNVHASVGVGSVPLLMGKSVLDKFKKWQIDNISETLVFEL